MTVMEKTQCFAGARASRRAACSISRACQPTSHRRRSDLSLSFGFLILAERFHSSPPLEPGGLATISHVIRAWRARVLFEARNQHCSVSSDFRSWHEVADTVGPCVLCARQGAVKAAAQRRWRNKESLRLNKIAIGIGETETGSVGEGRVAL